MWKVSFLFSPFKNLIISVFLKIKQNSKLFLFYSFYLFVYLLLVLVFTFNVAWKNNVFVIFHVSFVFILVLMLCDFISSVGFHLH